MKIFKASELPSAHALLQSPSANWKLISTVKYLIDPIYCEKYIIIVDKPHFRFELYRPALVRYFDLNTGKRIGTSELNKNFVVYFPPEEGGAH